MATTRIIPLHIGKGRTESQAVSDIIDYVGNKKDYDYADLYGLIILIDNYNIPEEGLCFF